METNIRLVKDQIDASILQTKLATQPLAALDVETTPVPWYSPDFRVLTIAVAFEEGEAWVLAVDHPESEYSPPYWKIFPAPRGQPMWVMQNGMFDFVALQKIGITLRTPWEDTMAAQYIIDVDKPKGLEALAERWLDEEGWKDIDYKAPEEESLDVLARLNGRDADATLRIWNRIQWELHTDHDFLDLYEHLLKPAMITLSEMEIQGVPVDLDYLLDFHAETEAKLDDLLQDIRTVAGDEKLNPNSTKQLQKLLFGKLGLPVMVFTPKGAPSTNREALHKIEKQHTIIPMLQKFRKMRKLLTASLGPWIDHTDSDNRMHPRYKPAHVKTGRLASENPNIQQVPRDKAVRRVFGGGSDWIMEVDYSQLELRIVAHIADEKRMKDAFAKDEDLHELTATLLGVDRQTGKMANFGLLYGAGPRKLKWIAEEEYGIELSEMEAEAIRARWFNAYPNIGKYHDEIVETARAQGGVRTETGRWRPLPDLHSDDWPKKGGAERQAINTPVQSLASDITLLMVNKLHNDPLLRTNGVKVLATVHDSILFEVPSGVPLETIKSYIVQEMEHPPLDVFGVKLAVPLKVDIKMGPNWGDAI